MQNRANGKKMFYFSRKLKNHLAQIPHHPLTVVEAPSGFGKTTAVREFLQQNKMGNVREYWYTCLGEPAAMAWRGICELLGNANSKIEAHLKDLEMPTMDTLLNLKRLLRDFTCKEETYLVIDNFQLVDSDIPRELISVFSKHGCENLHMIFITQQLRSKQQYLIHNSDILNIESSAFFFDREGTESLFRMEGIRLSEEELENVFLNTEGWVSAIRLQILNYKQTGAFDHTADIEHLVDAAIWRRLSDEEQHFLLSVSVMDSFSVRQAIIISGCDTLPENIEKLLKTNDFIRYYPENSTFTVHSILQEYLRNRFYHHQPQEFQNEILYKTGKSYAAIGQHYLAAQFFMKIKDFDAILSLPLDGSYLVNQKENGILDFFADMINQCPDATLIRYPGMILLLAYHMAIDGRQNEFQKLCGLIEGAIEIENGSDQYNLRGECAFLSALSAFNHVAAMREGYQKALDLLKGPSSVAAANMPWSFGGMSLLSAFWCESGALSEQVDQMDSCMPDYQVLTQGHCAGASSAFRAEALLMRGEDDKAEILCHKALFEARSRKQLGICLCVELTMAQIFILRGDADSFAAVLKNIQGYTKDSSNRYLMRMAEMSLSFLYLVLGIRENAVPWLNDIETINNVLYAPSIPFALVLYAKILVLEKRYNEFFGISQLVMDSAKRIGKKEQYLLPQVYQLISLAGAKHSCGYSMESQGLLREALSMALPDMVYLPFAQQDSGIDLLLEPAWSFYAQTTGADGVYSNGIRSGNASAALQSNAAYASMKVLCKRHEKGAAVIKKALFLIKSPLTPREREIAGLAKERLSAKEIADKLYISEATVRTILRSVYSKLDIHSKSELNAKDF